MEMEMEMDDKYNNSSSDVETPNDENDENDVNDVNDTTFKQAEPDAVLEKTIYYRC